MSILVRGMDLPTSCGNCHLRKSNKNRVWCSVVGKYICFETEFFGRLNDCPLIEVESPHGDLIDRNETIKAIGGRPHVGIGINDDDDEFESGMSCQWGHDTGTIKDMPAIIKAEGSDT